MIDICIISVVNNDDYYNKYILENPYLKNRKNIHFIKIENTIKNKPIPLLYNDFLTNNKENDCWFIFCHQDWELKDDIELILQKLDKNKIYGPIGGKSEVIDGKIYSYTVGYTIDKSRDNKAQKISGNINHKILQTDTLDCMAMFVHSDIVNKHNLKFDESLNWDLYIEDFCINANLNHKIFSQAVVVNNCHHSNAAFKNLPDTYIKAKEYLAKKYPNHFFGGSCGLIGGKQYIEPAKNEAILYQLRKNIYLTKEKQQKRK